MSVRSRIVLNDARAHGHRTSRPDSSPLSTRCNLETLIIKLIVLVGSVVGTFLIGTLMIFVTPYAFFGLPYVLLSNGFWKNRCRDGLKLTWWAHKQLLRLPYTIVMIGQGKTKH